jgi:hypothetical protein
MFESDTNDFHLTTISLSLLSSYDGGTYSKVAVFNSFFFFAHVFHFNNRFNVVGCQWYIKCLNC